MAVLYFQDTFLNQLRLQRVPVSMHLLNGIQLKGLVKGFDTYAIILESTGKQQIIYKHAILTITPHTMFKINPQKEALTPV